MVSLIPRLSSFAVSGTPARSQVSDLIHVLRFVLEYFLIARHLTHVSSSRFLRIPQLVQEPKIWGRLQRPEHVNQFVELFNKIRYQVCHAFVFTLVDRDSVFDRTTKASVKDELTIPKQTRFLVPIQLGKVEKHVRAVSSMALHD